MSITLEWYDIVLRLSLTITAGILFGANRTEKGRAAGMVTTVLVSLAAAVTMIQANLLLSIAGKSSDSFVTLDLMRLPLGILTGMGFIGAGVILRRGEAIRGITTAAILWLVTVIGLCFGGGQLGLGLVASALGLLALELLKRLEGRMRQDRRGILILRFADPGPSEEEIRAQLLSSGCRITSWSMTLHKAKENPHYTLRYEVEWHATPSELRPPVPLDQLAQRPHLRMMCWKS